MTDASRPGLDETPAASTLVTNVVKVAVVVLLVGLLYLAVIRFSASPSPVGGVDLTVVQVGANWSVRFTAVPPAKLPSEMFIVLRDPAGAIAVPRTALENLTAGNWSLAFAVYEKSNPAAGEVQAGDRLLIDRAAHPPGTVLDVTDDRSVLAIDTLR